MELNISITGESVLGLFEFLILATAAISFIFLDFSVFAINLLLGQEHEVQYARVGPKLLYD